MTIPSIAQQVILKSYASGIPDASHFEIIEYPIPQLAENEFLVRNEFLSVDPAMRGWVNQTPNYMQMKLDDVVPAQAAGTVIASRHPDYAEGEQVVGALGWQDYAISSGDDIRIVKERDLPLSLSLGILGFNGVTAYFGLFDMGRPVGGDTVMVSIAAGAVGSAVGQLAKIAGCRTVGIAGGKTKVNLCKEQFGYDAAIDYKSGEDLNDAINQACPDGVNVYFDSTAGQISDAVMRHLALRARVVICGTASISSWDPPPLGPRVERHLLVKRASMQGFLITDYLHRYEEALARLTTWVRTGSLRYQEDILDGIESCPGSIAGLYRGENMGKRIIRLKI